MRIVVAIATAALTLGMASQPMQAQVNADVPAVESIHMIDAMTGWAVIRDQNRSDSEPALGVARTTDGGSSWRDVTPPAGRLSRFYALPQLFVFTASFAYVNGARTIDGGRTWRPMNISTGGVLGWIDFANVHDGWMLIADPAGGSMANPELVVYRSTDGGETWIRAERHGFFPESVAALTGVSATTAWATSRVVTGWSPLMVTRDAGRNWTLQKVPLPPGVTPPWDSRAMPLKFFTARDGILSVLYSNVDPQKFHAGFAHTASFAISYLTHDAGTTWTYTTPVSVSDQAWRGDYYGRSFWGGWIMHFADINHGWIADGDALYATANSGRQWTMIRSTSFPGAKQLYFISPQVGWAVTHSFPFLLKTVDAGRTWAPVPYAVLRQ